MGALGGAQLGTRAGTGGTANSRPTERPGSPEPKAWPTDVLPPKDIPAIRKEAEDALRPAFDHSDVADVETWVQRCIDDQAQLWRMNAYWIISEVQDTKKGRAVHLAFSAGCTNPPLSMK